MNELIKQLLSLASDLFRSLSLCRLSLLSFCCFTLVCYVSLIFGFSSASSHHFACHFRVEQTGHHHSSRHVSSSWLVAFRMFIWAVFTSAIESEFALDVGMNEAALLTKIALWKVGALFGWMVKLAVISIFAIRVVLALGFFGFAVFLLANIILVFSKINDFVFHIDLQRSIGFTFNSLILRKVISSNSSFFQVIFRISLF